MNRIGNLELLDLVAYSEGSILLSLSVTNICDSPTVCRRTQICTLIHANLESQIPSLVTKPNSSIPKPDHQSPAMSLRLAFFHLQMLCFSALCGPNEQKFGTLLTWTLVISPQIFLPNLFTDGQENVTFAAKKCKPTLKSRTLVL